MQIVFHNSKFLIDQLCFLAFLFYGFHWQKSLVTSFLVLHFIVEKQQQKLHCGLQH